MKKISRTMARRLLAVAGAVLVAGVGAVAHTASADEVPGFPELPQADLYVEELLERVPGVLPDGTRLWFIKPVFGNRGPANLFAGTYELRVSVPADSGVTVTFEGNAFRCATGQPPTVCVVVPNVGLPSGDTFIPGEFRITGGQEPGVLVRYSITGLVVNPPGADPDDDDNTVLV